MRSLSTSELKSIQLEILCVVDRFCRENQIKYWLDYGTLLGAVRHRGYIPWDDDIDLGMFRKDYDKFISEFNRVGEQKYIVRTCKNDMRFPWTFAKVMDMDTVLYEPDENGYKHHINIDIFVYDNASDNEAEFRKKFAKCRMYQRMHNQQTGTEPVNGTPFHRILQSGARIVGKCMPRGFFADLMDKERQSLNDNFCGYVANYSISSPRIPRDIFESIVQLDFEGADYPAPLDYDIRLRYLYGNYMQLPEVEKRINPHSFVAYLMEGK